MVMRLVRPMAAETVASPPRRFVYRGTRADEGHPLRRESDPRENIVCGYKMAQPIAWAVLVVDSARLGR